MWQVYGWRIASIAGLSIAIAGCTMFTSTTDGISSSVEAISDTTSSTTKKLTPDSDKKVANFVNVRFDAIRYEAARGAGENLEALAILLGERDQSKFARWMKDNYGRIFDGVVTPKDLLTRLEAYPGGELG